jgi:transposase
MGRTKVGQSAPYCPKCERQTLKLRDKFGTPCPNCATPTVWYHDYEMNRMRNLLHRVERS